MINIGSHVSQKDPDGLLGSVKETLDNNANALMFYTGAPQTTVRKDLSLLKIKEAKELIDKHNIRKENIIVHAPYLINLANPDPEKQEFALNFLVSEIKRADKMFANAIVLHPGAHLGEGPEAAIKRIADALNKAIEKTNDCTIKIALETMAGKGTEVGRTFEELKQIMDKVDNKDRIGVCFDTCHTFDSGYDLVNDYENVINKFDNVIGLDKILVIHLNDSKNELGSKKDRHENIGFGNIGFDTLVKVVYDKRFSHIPKILETPYVEKKSPYKLEIEMIRNKSFDKDLFKNL